MNKTKVLVLQGRHNTGKTTTLNELPKVLELSGAVLLGKPHHIHKDDYAYLFKWNEKTISIVTIGDKWGTDEDQVGRDVSIVVGLKMLNQYENPTCDLYVFAARSSGETIKGIEGYATKHHLGPVLSLGTSVVTWNRDRKARVDEWTPAVHDHQAQCLKELAETLLFDDNN